MIDIANQHQSRMAGDGFEEVMHEENIQHRGFIDNHQVRRKRPLLIALKTSEVGAVFEQPMERAGRIARGFAQTFGRPSRWRGQTDARIHLAKNGQDRTNESRLSGAWSSGDDQTFVR